MTDWYYVRQGERVGPIDDFEFQGLVDAGRIASDTLVWHSGMAEWQRHGEVRAQSKGRTATGSATMGRTSSPVGQATGEGYACAECGNSFPLDDMVRYGETLVCARCKPIFFQRLKEGSALPATLVYGGFWIRFVAKIVDGLILGVVNYSLQFLLTIVGLTASGPVGGRPGPAFFALLFVRMLVQIAVAVSYSTFFVGKYAATPGKMACGLRVITSDRGRVTYLRAFARYFAEMLSSLILGIGYIMAAFDEEKRTLHDRICDTRVIRK
ncbi:RDD family protein [Candidatus Poribacteria bacterium]|nr:RDD family protein [Candidatus Poribacteria bacterium]